MSVAVRIAGVNLPVNKNINIALKAIFGIGTTRALDICKATGVDYSRKVKDLSEQELSLIRDEVGKYLIEGDLRREVSMNIKRKMDIGCYEGIRHRCGLPLRKNTKNNARTRKGKRKPIRA